MSNISESTQVILPHAIKSEKNFNTIKRRAEEIGMRVNSAKTQLLCISGSTSATVRSYIRTECGNEIKSAPELKILGFWFGTRPNVAVHVTKLAEKFRARLWSLRHLKRSGMLPGDLLFIYLSILRPVLDFAAPTYHSLLSATQTETLETLQRKALKIVYGNSVSYREALAIANIQTLNDRRAELLKKFAEKTLKNPRYSDGWFPKIPQKQYKTRQNRPFLECLLSD